MLEYFKFICVLYSLGFYVSVLITCYIHRHYIYTLCFKRIEEKVDKNRKYLCNCIFARVVPIYRHEYFGYDGICLWDYDKKLLEADHKFRVFGHIKVNSKCIVIFKKNVVKTVIVVTDKTFGLKVEEDLRKIYKRVILFITGGAILWKVFLLYMI